LYKRALGIWEQALGETHPQVAGPLNNLADLYTERGKYGEAERLYKRALGIWEQTLGPEHPNVAYPLSGLANLYYVQGKYGEAERLYKRALEIREQRLGLGHPLTRQVVKNFAVFLRAMRREREANDLEARFPPES
jgi:tetratricopeptide (TPR) repeat protein